MYQIGWENISNYFARACAGIHENSDVLVTVGLGMIKYNSDKYEGNYVWQNPWFSFPFDKSPMDFGLDKTKPSLIGEVASLDESGSTIMERYEGAYNNGWNGVMAWTSNGVDSCGGYKDVEPAIKRMLELIPDLIHPLE